LVAGVCGQDQGELVQSQAASAEIEERIRRLHEKPAETKPVSAESLIYFLCPDRANKTKAEALLDALERHGVRVDPR
jgi:hypothetical protein